MRKKVGQGNLGSLTYRERLHKARSTIEEVNLPSRYEAHHDGGRAYNLGKGPKIEHRQKI
jgi:hypothetical protein